MNRVGIVLTGLAIAFAAPASAMIADFQDGTQGWTHGFQAPNTVTQALNAGPEGSGDHALQVVPRQNLPQRMNPHTTTNPDFVGDFIAMGVTEVSFDAMAPIGNLDNVVLRAVIFRNQRAIQWISTDSAALANDGVWRSFTLSLAEMDMVDQSNTMNYAGDFADVQRFGLRHQVAAAQDLGDALDTSTTVFLDNITLPEPSAGAAGLATLLSFGLAARARRTR